MTTLALPLNDLNWLKRRVTNFAEDRPGVYRMLSPNGKVIYVGKAKQLRTRLLSYFRATYPDDKAARILHAAGDIEWKYSSSEFAALLEELRQIKRYRPTFNVRMNRRRRWVFVKVSAGAAPKLFVGSANPSEGTRLYGPLANSSHVQTGVKVLNDLLGLRDCSLNMPIVYAEQGDLFGPHTRAACLRHEIGTCTGPCGGFVTEEEYRNKVSIAIDFLEGRSIAPLDRVVAEMTGAGDANEFERAAWWRDRFDALEWLLRTLSCARTSIEALSFVYYDTAAYGDHRAYLVQRGIVRTVAPVPETPIEHEAFRATVRQHLESEPDNGTIPASHIDEMLLLMSWFNSRPSAMRRTVPISTWLDQ